jgi:mannosyl-oligosaccharide alpha-1,2-mannosidase
MRHSRAPLTSTHYPDPDPTTPEEKFNWLAVPTQYPVQSIAPLPPRVRARIPKIQATFARESRAQRKERLHRLAAVKSNFTHAWNGYKSHAWLKDEVGPLSGNSQDHFGGWAASLVDALDTLWIMGMKDEFEHAISAINQIDFRQADGTTFHVFCVFLNYRLHHTSSLPQHLRLG